MSYPPPPGINNLPAKPPASTNKSSFTSGGFKSSGFKPAYSNSPATASPTTYGSAPSYPGASSASPAASYGPSVPPTQYGASGSSYGGYGGSSGMSAGAPGASSYSYGAQSQYGAAAYPQQPSSYGAQSYGAAPQMRNPFPQPGTAAAAAAATAAGPTSYNSHNDDPEMAAQIAQWQSAYTQREADPDAAPLSTIPAAPTPAVPTSTHAKTVKREGGGKKWTDETLLEWDPSHLRLFVGNLAGETTDESLLKAFSRWTSVQKAKVVRDKRSTKSKGYGFVSFSDADDFFQAAKEMNGKYIQSHPVTVKKANTEIKVTNVKEKDRRGGKNNRNRNNNNNNNKEKKSGSGGGQGGSGGGYETNLGPHGGGIVKPGQKTKSGLRLLG